MFPQRERPTTVVAQGFSRAGKKKSIGEGWFVGFFLMMELFKREKRKKEWNGHAQELFTIILGEKKEK